MKCALIASVKKLRVAMPCYFAISRLQQRIVFVHKERVLFRAHGHQLHAITCRRFCVVLSVEARKHQQVVVFHSFFNSATVNVGGGCTRESKPQMPHSQARYLKCDAPHQNETCSQGIDDIVPFLWPIAPSGNRLRQNLSTRKHRFSFLAHTTSVSPLLC